MQRVLKDFIITSAFLAVGVIAILLLRQGNPTITGMVVTRANISQALPDNCTTEIPSGKNLVSFYCIPRTLNRDNITSSLVDLNRMFTYDSADNTDPWKAYNPSMPNWTVQDLTVVSREDAYWMFLDASNVFLYNGLAASGQHISLAAGWNLVGMATNSQIPLGTLFASINGSYNLVLSFNNTNKAVLAFYPLGNGVNSINNSSPFLGYWINMSSADTWDVP